MKRTQTKKKKESSRRKTSRSNKALKRGALGAGAAYALLAIVIIAGAAAMMIGNITPSGQQPQGQPVIITLNPAQPKQNNLQLYTFPGATYTPTPSPTPVPQPRQNFPVGNGNGSGGGSTCLVAGTKILMVDGSHKNIEDIKPGDKVMGYNTLKKQLAPETVLATDAPIRDHHYNIKLADGTVIGLTREHPLYSNNGWASIDPASTLAENSHLHVAKLHVGDKLLEASGHYVSIISMTYIPGNVQTYNLKNVTGYNDFIADGIVTHNKGGTGGGGSSSTAR